MPLYSVTEENNGAGKANRSLNPPLYTSVNTSAHPHGHVSPGDGGTGGKLRHKAPGAHDAHTEKLGTDVTLKLGTDVTRVQFR